MKSCPKCKSENVKPRTGTLGEAKGVWCADCGHTSMTVAEWENAPRHPSIHATTTVTATGIGVDVDLRDLSSNDLDIVARRFGVIRGWLETNEQLIRRIHDQVELNAIGL